MEGVGRMCGGVMEGALKVARGCGNIREIPTRGGLVEVETARVMLEALEDIVLEVVGKVPEVRPCNSGGAWAR